MTRCVVVGATDIGSGRSVADGVKRPVLVFFIGGVTYAEISALRFLSSKDESMIVYFYPNFIAQLFPFSDYEFLIASTHILNGDSMLKSLNGDYL